MAKFSIKRMDRHNQKDCQRWIHFLSKANGITIFHHPNFLSYHGERFDEHHLGIFKGEELFGLIPLSIDNDSIKTAKSPYGASYGGFIFQKVLSYLESKEIIEIFLEYLHKVSVNKVIITPSLPVYYNEYSDTFIFSMIEQGFSTFNSDISSVVQLNNNIEKFSTRGKRILKKINTSELTINFDSNINDFYNLIEKTFNKHATKPTHSKEELIYLKDKFPNEIKFPVVYFNDQAIAAVGEFKINDKVLMSFYICQDDNFKQLNAQTYLMKNLFDNAYSNGFIFYDLGTSSVNMKARENIFSFKEGLGAIGIFRHSFIRHQI